MDLSVEKNYLKFVFRIECYESVSYLRYCIGQGQVRKQKSDQLF